MARATKILEGHEAVEEIFMGYRLYESRMTCSFVKIGMERGDQTADCSDRSFSHRVVGL